MRTPPWQAILLLATCLAAGGCGGGGGGATPSFEGAKAYAELEKLMSFGPRFTGSVGMRKQRELVIATLRASGAEVVTQDFDLKLVDEEKVESLQNIIGRFQPERPDRVAVITHYDTRREAEQDPDLKMRGAPIPGANDGGSGTAIMLALAPILAAHPAPVGVDLIFFDGEEWGKPTARTEYCQGSRHFEKHWQNVYPERSPQWVICLDMVGDRDLQIPMDPRCAKLAPQLVKKLLQVARAQGATAFSDRQYEFDIGDDHSVFLTRGVPAVLLIDYDYKSPEGVNWYHTLQDTIDKCSAASLHQVGRVVEAMVYHPELE